MLRFVLLIILGFIGYYIWSNYPINHGPGEITPNKPIINRVSWEKPFYFKEAQVIPLRKLTAKVRVLKTEKYYFDTRSNLSNIDILVGWAELSDERNLNHIRFSLSKRNFDYKFTTPPLPINKILSQINLWHIIPSTSGISADFYRLREGNIIEITGLIVDIESTDYISWKSELENKSNASVLNTILYVEKLKIL